MACNNQLTAHNDSRQFSVKIDSEYQPSNENDIMKHIFDKQSEGISEIFKEIKETFSNVYESRPHPNQKKSFEKSKAS